MRGTAAGLSTSCEITVTSYGTRGSKSAAKPRETLLLLHLFHPSAEDRVRLRVYPRARHVAKPSIRGVYSSEKSSYSRYFSAQEGYRLRQRLSGRSVGRSFAPTSSIRTRFLHRLRTLAVGCAVMPPLSRRELNEGICQQKHNYCATRPHV